MKIHLAKRNSEGRITLRKSECGRMSSRSFSETVEIVNTKKFNEWNERNSDTSCCKQCLLIAYEQNRLRK